MPSLDVRLWHLADMGTNGRQVRFVPTADIAVASRSRLIHWLEVVAD